MKIGRDKSLTSFAKGEEDERNTPSTAGFYLHFITLVTLLPPCGMSNHAPADFNKLTKLSQIPASSDSI